MGGASAASGERSNEFLPFTNLSKLLNLRGLMAPPVGVATWGLLMRLLLARILNNIARIRFFDRGSGWDVVLPNGLVEYLPS